MQLSKTLAQQLRQVFFGGNWTASNVQTVLETVTFEQATSSVAFTTNTIVVLTFHIHYYLRETAKVLEGCRLDAHDKYSFDAPDLQSEADWVAFRQLILDQADYFANLVEALPEEHWDQFLADPQYGNYYRNIQGIIEHTHYHLGQIALVKNALSNA